MWCFSSYLFIYPSIYLLSFWENCHPKHIDHIFFGISPPQCLCIQATCMPLRFPLTKESEPFLQLTFFYPLLDVLKILALMAREVDFFLSQLWDKICFVGSMLQVFFFVPSRWKESWEQTDRPTWTCSGWQRNEPVPYWLCRQNCLPPDTGMGVALAASRNGATGLLWACWIGSQPLWCDRQVFFDLPSALSPHYPKVWLLLPWKILSYPPFLLHF